METKAQHTPGPWEYVPTCGEDNPRVLSAHVNKGGNFYIAVCNLDEDARLIAAAPDLLEACRMLTHVKLNGAGGLHTLGDCVAAATEALAKAEGHQD